MRKRSDVWLGFLPAFILLVGGVTTLASGLRTGAMLLIGSVMYGLIAWRYEHWYKQWRERDK